MSTETFNEFGWIGHQCSDISDPSIDDVTRKMIKRFSDKHTGAVHEAFDDEALRELDVPRQYNFNTGEIFNKAAIDALSLYHHLVGAKKEMSIEMYSTGMIALAAVACAFPDQIWKKTDYYKHSEFENLDPCQLLWSAYSAITRQPLDGEDQDLQKKSRDFYEICDWYEFVLKRTLDLGIEKTMFGGSQDQRDATLERLRYIRESWDEAVQYFQNNSSQPILGQG